MDIFLAFYSKYNTAISILIIIVMAYVISRLLQWMLNKGINEMSGRLNIDPTRYKFFKNTLNAVIVTVAVILIIYSIPKLKTLAITLFAGAGILVAIIGLAAQQAFSNVISGVFIIISKPYRVGDMIKVGEKNYGFVEDITLRHTVIRDFQNKSIIIPNSTMSDETIVNDNIEDPTVCRWIEIGISYDSDIDLAMRILQEEAMKHPNCIDKRTKKEKKDGIPQVQVRLVEFGDYSLNLRTYVWTDKPFEVFKMHGDLNLSIKKRFDKEGIEIPFPYRTIVYKNDIPPNSKSESTS